jgi:hypothetical protein
LSIVRIHRRGRKQLLSCPHDDGMIVRAASGPWLMRETLTCTGCGAAVVIDALKVEYLPREARTIRARFASIRRPLKVAA